MIIASKDGRKRKWSCTVKKITLILMFIVLIASLLADAKPGRDTSNQPLYANDMIKIKLTAKAYDRLSLPQGLYAEQAFFGESMLDNTMFQIGGSALIRAHRRLKNRAWEIEHGFDRWFLIRLDGKVSVVDALSLVKDNPHIEDASFEYYAYLQITPNDPYFGSNWGHNNTGQGPGGGGAGFDSDAPQAWDQQQGFGSPDIIVAIIDSGVNYNHADLNDNCIAGYDYGSNDDNPMDSNGHGTSCAGVAAGEVNNSIGVAGVAGGCRIMPLKVMSNNGNMTFTSITNAITHAADNGANVISMSLGAEGGTQEGSYPTTDAALYYAYNAGCVILAATANANTSSIAYPANHTAVISVGAASPTGQRKSYSSSDGQNWWGSNYGVNIQDDPKSVDIMAATILPAPSVSGGYSTDFNGTSCATPYAAGVAALILSKDSSLTPAQVREAIVSTATDMTIDGGAGWDRYTGYGMINANAALNSIVSGMPSCVITAPQNNSIHDLGDIINVAVNAADSNGSIVSVAFYLNDNTTPEAVSTSAPYQWSWNTQSASSGAYQIRAVATDNENNSRQSTVSIFILASPDEGFESGNFAAYDWVNNSSSPWTIQSSNVYTGAFAAKAGTITHLQTTTLNITMEISAAGFISFFNKVSSEANYDYMRFFIDGAQQAQWSGTIDWTLRSFAVQPGNRTFAWTYYKDQGVNSGSDTAWLDHIVFPPHGSAPLAPTNLIALPLSSQQIQLAWNDNSDNESEFYIEVLDGDVWSFTNWTAQNVASVIIDGLVSQTAYSFRVRAVNGNESSNYSNIATATTLGLDSPLSVMANAELNSVNLSWLPPTGVVNGYQVWRFTVLNGMPDAGTNLTPEPITQNSFVDHAWREQAAGAYLWKVVAISNNGTSAPALSNTLQKEASANIFGIITNEAGNPIPNATISIAAFTELSNVQGAYSILLMPAVYSISVSAEGFETATVENIMLASGQALEMNFQLQTDPSDEDDPLTSPIVGIKSIYPNPFTNSTTIQLELGKSKSPYKLSIYNLKGEVVYRHSGIDSGSQQILWNAKDMRDKKLGSGIYLLRWENASLRQTKKLFLMN